MKHDKTLTRSAALATLFAVAGLAHAQDRMQQEIEPVVPAGPPVVPTVPVPVGPAIQPVIPLENLQGVETVTLDTPKGPVVVVSWPTSGAALSSDTNVDFRGMDRDRDGFLSRDEVSAAASTSGAAKRLSEQRFDAIDIDRDNRLSSSEILVWVHR